MLRDSLHAVNPHVHDAVLQLLREEARYDQTVHRSQHREPLVRPVRLEFTATGLILNGCSRRLSAAGINLLTDQPIQPSVVARLEILSLEGPPLVFLAECRCCHLFGEDWHQSGWHFVNLVNKRASGL